MRSVIIIIPLVLLAGSASGQDTLTEGLASWFVKTSLYDRQTHRVKEQVIFDETIESYLELYSTLQDSGFVKLTPADSVYIDANPSHQVIEVELLKKSQQYILDSTFTEVAKNVEIVLYTYDSLEILSINELNNYYEIKFRIVNPNPTPFYITWNRGEDARQKSFDSIRYVRLNNGSWEIDRYPFSN